MSELEYQESRIPCPICGQLNEPDAYPKCSYCGYYDPRSDTGRIMENRREPDPWEKDRDDYDGPGCVSPRHG